MSPLLHALLALAATALHAQPAPAPAELTAKIEQAGAKLGSCSAPTQLFEITEVAGKRLVVLHQNQLEKCTYLLSATLEQGTGEPGVYSSAMKETFLIGFKWTGSKIQLVRKQSYHRAAPGTPEAKTVERSFPDQPLASLTSISSDPVKGIFVISADEWFLQDLANVRASIARTYGLFMPSPEESTVDLFEAHPKNLEAGAQLVFRRGDPTPVEPRIVAVKMRYSISELPGPGFEPRAADQRVGHFGTSYVDYSRPDLKLTETPAVYLANRWRLEKKEPDAPISEPKEPIVYWLEDTIPDEYRPALRAGIESWNAAFEAIGFRNAVVVKDMRDLSPEERIAFNPASAAHNMVRWYMGNQSGSAWGPSRADPYTGEIFNALVAIADFRGRSEVSATRLGKGLKSDGHANHDCMAHMADDARATYEILQARGNAGASEMKRFMNEFLTGVTAHEVGHTLGLRHNFKASSTVTPEDKANGILFNSIMDYRLPDIAAPGEAQGPFYQTKVGPYDHWAIEYAYKPLAGGAKEQAAELDRIASRAQTDKRLAYASDYEADDADPDVQRYDMGPDPIAMAKKRTAIAVDTWSRLSADANATGADLRSRYSAGYSSYHHGVAAVLPLVGGVRSSRELSGPVHVPVSAAEQRQALQFLQDNVFSTKAFDLPQEVVARIGQDRLAREPGAPMNPAAVAARLQDEVLDSLFEKSRLDRLVQRESLVTAPADAFTLRDLFGSVRDGVWKEVIGKQRSAIDLKRRQLQRRHVAILSGLIVNETGTSLPASETRSAAGANLSELRPKLNAAIADKKLDQSTREHLIDIRQSIEAALKARDAS